MEGAELGGTRCNAVRIPQFLKEFVCEAYAFGGFRRGQTFADGVGDVAGQDLRAFFIFDRSKMRS